MPLVTWLHMMVYPAAMHLSHVHVVWRGGQHMFIRQVLRQDSLMKSLEIRIFGEADSFFCFWSH